ncbi:hypothetical protein NST07_20790 [Paenibacillus sp. FSL L8-0340]|uniref:hypothetical protein n=1 Tax=Paenibacillus sp. FSL L8-0340 TaxID=2954685 RepID=UPI0031593546
MGLKAVPNVAPENKSLWADKITILVIDPATGEEIRKDLPISFRQNQLGTWLQGNDEFGDAQAIVFLTAFGQQQLSEIIGIEPARLGGEV